MGWESGWNYVPQMLLWIVMVYVAVLGFSTLTKRDHENNDGRYAWYVLMPGIIQETDEENRIFADESVGTEIHGLGSALLDREIAELQYLSALKGTGYYKNYEFRRVKEHWCLFCPKKQVRYFSTRAPYRISPWFVHKGRTLDSS